MKKLLISAAMALCLSPTAHAADLSETELKALVLEAIRENPEVVMEAIQILQAREQEERDAAAERAVSDNRELLQTDPNAPVMGNPDGEIIVVEFFDYNCGFCRRAFSNVKALVADEPNVRLIMREWPILGEGSVFAARASLASRRQDKYEEFHVALMEAPGRADEATVINVARSVGLDIKQLRSDMDLPEVDEHIAKSSELSQALGINGTPAFVFGDTLVPGAIELDQMKELVEMLGAS